jgi:hypothetical protein
MGAAILVHLASRNLVHHGWYKCRYKINPGVVTIALGKNMFS